MKKLKKLIFGNKYIFKKDFYTEALPLSWYAKKGEMATYEGKSLGYTHMRVGRRAVLMSKKEAFDFLEEMEERDEKET